MGAPLPICTLPVPPLASAPDLKYIAHIPPRYVCPRWGANPHACPTSVNTSTTPNIIFTSAAGNKRWWPLSKFTSLAVRQIVSRKPPSLYTLEAVFWLCVGMPEVGATGSCLHVPGHDEKHIYFKTLRIPSADSEHCFLSPIEVARLAASQNNIWASRGGPSDGRGLPSHSI